MLLFEIKAILFEKKKKVYKLQISLYFPALKYLKLEKLHILFRFRECPARRDLVIARKVSPRIRVGKAEAMTGKLQRVFRILGRAKRSLKKCR